MLDLIGQQACWPIILFMSPQSHKLFIFVGARQSFLKNPKTNQSLAMQYSTGFWTAIEIWVGPIKKSREDLIKF